MERMKVAFLTNGTSPVPATKGGAVENLIEDLLDENEKRHGFDFTVFSLYEEKAKQQFINYAFIDNEDYSFECTCGSPYCRHTVTGFDWKIKELQTKYYPYFAQYLKDKIDIENLTK